MVAKEIRTLYEKVWNAPICLTLIVILLSTVVWALPNLKKSHLEKQKTAFPPDIMSPHPHNVTNAE